jgi:hypothetical protein
MVNFLKVNRKPTVPKDSVVRRDKRRLALPGNIIFQKKVRECIFYYSFQG